MELRSLITIIWCIQNALKITCDGNITECIIPTCRLWRIIVVFFVWLCPVATPHLLEWVQMNLLNLNLLLLHRWKSCLLRSVITSIETFDFLRWALRRELQDAWKFRCGATCSFFCYLLEWGFDWLLTETMMHAYESFWHVFGRWISLAWYTGWDKT